MLPPPSHIKLKKLKTTTTTKIQAKQNKTKEEQSKTTKQKEEQTNKQAIKCGARTWNSGLYVALHMRYRHLTLSLTTVDSWSTGVICEVVNPQRPDQDWLYWVHMFNGMWKVCLS